MYSTTVIIVYFYAVLISGLGCGLQVEVGDLALDGFYERTHMFDGKWGFSMENNLLQWGDTTAGEAWEIIAPGAGTLVGCDAPGEGLYPPSGETWEYYKTDGSRERFKDVVMTSDCEEANCGVTITAGDSEVDGHYSLVQTVNGKGQFQKDSTTLQCNGETWQIETPAGGVMAGTFATETTYAPPTDQTWVYHREDDTRVVFKNVQVVLDCPETLSSTRRENSTAAVSSKLSLAAYFAFAFLCGSGLTFVYTGHQKRLNHEPLLQDIDLKTQEA